MSAANKIFTKQRIQKPSITHLLESAKTDTSSRKEENASIHEVDHEKKCLMSYANNKSEDQPAQPRSLISAFDFAA